MMTTRKNPAKSHHLPSISASINTTTHGECVRFDPAAVVNRADVAGSGMANGCPVVGGDFLDSMPEGADAYLLRHILHNLGGRADGSE